MTSIGQLIRSEIDDDGVEWRRLGPAIRQGAVPDELRYSCNPRRCRSTFARFRQRLKALEPCTRP